MDAQYSRKEEDGAQGMFGLLTRGYRMSSSEAALIAANMVPLAGVLFWDWSLFSIMVLYWLENVVVGIYNVARMVRATGTVSRYQARIGGKPYTSELKSSTIFFFILHYGLFTLVHGAFVAALFGPPDMTALAMFFGVGSLFISHGISYLKNFIGNKEYEQVCPADLFIQPYKRVIIFHLVLLFGGVAAKVLGAPVFSLVLLIFLKTAVDRYSHLLEHRTFAPSNPA